MKRIHCDKTEKRTNKCRKCKNYNKLINNNSTNATDNNTNYDKMNKDNNGYKKLPIDCYNYGDKFRRSLL